jgi:hypothetical protein
MTSERLLLTLATLALAAVAYLLMLKGWRGRLRRQSDLPPPPAAPGMPAPVLVPATAGLFVGTTFADDWLDRVAAHGLAHRAAGWVSVRADGVLFDREGAGELFVPFSAVARAEVGDALAGKVIGKGGMLLLDWQLGPRLLTSGFRADDHGEHRRLADAIHAHLPVTEEKA